MAPNVPLGMVLPRPRIALQPIVDLRTGEMVGGRSAEPFSATPHPQPVFEQARALGRLAELESTAISAARAVALPGLLLTINLDITSLPSPRIRAALSGDLTDLVLEVTEHTHSPADPEVLAAVQASVRDYRDRGAIIAVDDWGTGYSDMARLELLEPEIVKIDMSIVHDLQSARHRALLGSLLAWAARRSARVCAEGIETEEQREQLRELGVHLGPGLPHRPTRASDRRPAATEADCRRAVRPERTPEHRPRAGS